MPDRCLHQAFLYDSLSQVVGALGPFAREGVERGDKVMLVARRALIDALREELGDFAPEVGMFDTTRSECRPYARLQGVWQQQAQLGPGQRLRAMGEPPWSSGAAEDRQWATWESVLNLTLDDAPISAVCAYDRAGLPDAVLEHASETHPLLYDDGHAVENPEYVDPSRFSAGAPDAAPAGASDLPLEWSELRERVRGLAEHAGVARDRHDDVVLAVQEMATNAEMYGRPPIRAQAWISERQLVCRIEDSGAGITDPTTGWFPPADPGGGGWGLPITRQVCDVVEIGSADPGTVVTLYVNRAA